MDYTNKVAEFVSRTPFESIPPAALEEAVKRNPDDSTDRVGLAFTLGDLGREEDAKRTVATILRLDPDFSIKKYVGRLSYRDPAELKRFEDGLRKAGLPE